MNTDTPLLRVALTARATTVEELSGGGDVLLLGPHPDDETLGCGAAIAALTDLGRRVQVVVVTDGCHSHPQSRAYPPARLRDLRAQEVTEAVRILTRGHGPDPILLDYPDNWAPDGTEAVDAAVARILPLVPDTTTAIWATWEGDPHPDHGRTARIAAKLADRLKLPLWSYPIWGRFADSGNFAADSVVQFQTEPWQALKIAAVAAHQSQMTGLIDDDPGGFTMGQDYQRHFITTPELFLKERG